MIPKISEINSKDKENSLADHGVRKYDDGIGRFTAIDPLWEKYYSWSPYHYCRNNPVWAVDPSGLADYYSSDGTRLGSDGNDEDNRKYITSIDIFQQATESNDWQEAQQNIIPSKETLQKIKEAKRKTTSKNETGLIEDSDGKPSQVIVGPTGKDCQENNVNLIPEANNLLQQNREPSIFIHFHLKNTAFCQSNYFVSEGDRETHAKIKEQILGLKNSIMINPNTNFFNFYNGSTTVFEVRTYTLDKIINDK